MFMPSSIFIEVWKRRFRVLENNYKFFSMIQSFSAEIIIIISNYLILTANNSVN